MAAPTVHGPVHATICPGRATLAAMRIGVLHNRASGRGKGPAFVQRLRALAPTRGFDVLDLPLDLASHAGALDDLDAVVLVGGDGTLHHALAFLTAAHGGRGVPTLIAPLGTENVVAKELGLRPRVAATLDALGALRRGAAPVRSDLGVVHHPDGRPGVPFALMLTIGPDAAIVHRVARRRTGTGGRLRFVAPTLARAARPRIGRLSVSVDGQPLASEQRGCLIVAVGPRYPMRLDLARKATRTDGLLDALFLPAGTTAELLAWALLARLGLHVGHPRARYAQGRRVEVTLHEHRPGAQELEDLQIDGEVERVACDAQGRLVVESLPAVLPLVPPAARQAMPIQPSPTRAGVSA